LDVFEFFDRKRIGLDGKQGKYSSKKHFLFLLYPMFFYEYQKVWFYNYTSRTVLACLPG
jgi:hypothetical protein